MKTVKIEMSATSLQLPEKIIKNRLMSHSDWIELHGSGTLKDNKDMKFVWSMQCLSERLAYTFGYGFSAFKSHLVTFNDSISECDEPAYTLAGRYMKHYLAKKLFEEDYFELKYVILKEEDGTRSWEGIGIIIRETSAKFIPDNTLVVAKVAQYIPHKGWENTINFA